MHEPRFAGREAPSGKEVLPMPEALKKLNLSEAQLRMGLAGLMSYEMKLSHEDYHHRPMRGRNVQDLDPDFPRNDEGMRVLGMVSGLYRQDENVRAYFDALAQERMTALKLARAERNEAYAAELRSKEVALHEENIRTAVLKFQEFGFAEDSVRRILDEAVKWAYRSK